MVAARAISLNAFITSGMSARSVARFCDTCCVRSVKLVVLIDAPYVRSAGQVFTPSSV
ncbi:hypothetical protein D3C72_2549770 [compost metagenome]